MQRLQYRDIYMSRYSGRQPCVCGWKRDHWAVIQKYANFFIGILQRHKQEVNGRINQVFERKQCRCVLQFVSSVLQRSRRARWVTQYRGRNTGGLDSGLVGVWVWRFTVAGLFGCKMRSLQSERQWTNGCMLQLIQTDSSLLACSCCSHCAHKLPFKRSN